MHGTSSERYIHLFTEPPKKESDWKDVEKDIENALRRNVQEVQKRTGASESRRDSVYLGDAGVVVMEVTLAERRRFSASSHYTTLAEKGPGDQDYLAHSLLKSLADHHLASAFHNSAFSGDAIRDGAHISFLETPVGVATLILSRYPIGRQKLFANTQWARSRNYLQMALEVIKSDDMESLEDDDGCEVLYGRAGFLYALLYLRSVLERARRRSQGMAETQKKEVDKEDTAAGEDLDSLKTLLSDPTLDTVVKSIVSRGQNGAKRYQVRLGGRKPPPLMWTWHGKRYLGGAHGVAGILQILLRCPTSIIADYMPDIVRTIDWLVRCQDRTGNWPTKASDTDRMTSNDHNLVQWCHGAPTILTLLSTVLRMSVTPGTKTELTERQQERFAVSLQRGCALVYMHGLLRKGVGLCHGVAGSVYALLAASDVLDDPPISTSASTTRPTSTSEPSSPAMSLGHHAPYFTQAAHLAYLATYSSSLTKKGDMKTPDHPWSLYEGMAGMCCAWQEILYRMQNRTKAYVCSGMPGYDDLAIGD